DEVADPDAADVVADLLDHPDELVPHPARLPYRRVAPVRPQVRPADAAGQHADDGVPGALQLGVRGLLQPDVVRGVQDGRPHGTTSTSFQKATRSVICFAASFGWE